MTKKPFMALALCAGLTVAVFAAPGTPAKNNQITVGEFAVKVASELGYEARDQKVAQEALRGLGVDLSANLSAPLTEGAVARIMADLGMSVVAPAAPNAPVSAAKAGFLAGAIGIQTSGLNVETPPLPISPPTQCLSQANRGQCVECCKAVVGQLPNPNGNLRDAGRECARFCKALTPPGKSEEEPQP